MALTKVKLIADGVIDVDHLAANHGITTDNIGEGTALYYTDARVSSYLTTNSYATEGYVTTAVSELVASAPSTLDTLNELAAALGDDPNFATTVTNSIAGKLPLTGGTLTGSLTTASPLTIQAASPYIQWKNASGTRLGYIQHNETDLVMSVDTGNIILDGGDVAIGTNPARAKLEVNGENYAVTNSGRSVGGIHISSTNNNGQDTYSGGISFAGPGSGSAAISGVQGTSDGDTQGLAFFTHPSGTGANNNVEYMRLTYDGKLGIGTTGPGDKLDVLGNIRISGVGNGLYFDTTGADASNGIKTINDYETVIFNDRGAAGFVVVGNNSVRLGFGTSYTAAQSSIYIPSVSGNVGIGTTSPSAKLEVRGDSGVPTISYNSPAITDGSYTLYQVGNSDGWEHGMAGSGDAYKYFFSYGTFGPSSAKVTFTNTGNVGIGTSSPAGKLNTYVSSDRQITHYGNNGDLSVISDNNSQTVFYIKGNGNAPMMSIHDSSKTAFQILGNRNMRIHHGYGDFYQHLGSVGTATGNYYHIRLRTPWDDTGMTMFRITGYHPYGNYAESYMGAYRYPNSTYRYSPYGQINHNQGTLAAAHSQYNTNADPGYLVLVIYWPTSYTGVTVEHIGAGDQYGARMDSALEIIDYVKTNDTTPQW